MRGLSRRLSYSNVMVTILAFLVLGGSAAYATGRLDRHSVGARELKPNAVNGSKVKAGSLRASDFRAGQLPAGLQGPRGPGGPQGPQGPAGPAGPSELGHVYQGHGTTAPGPVSEEQWGSTVVDLAVPAGNYFVTSSVEAQSQGNVAISCRLIAGSSGPSTERTLIPEALRRVNMNLTAAFAVPAGQSLKLQCDRLSDSHIFAQIVAANLVAVQVGTIDGAAG